MANVQFSDMLALSPEKRLELAELLWDSLEDRPEILPLSDAEKTELDERLRYYYENKDKSLSWAVVKRMMIC
ncbi:MAG: addiction module protein [Bacteroidota bacterium]